MTDDRTIVTNSRKGGRVAGKPNPLPASAKELEKLFFRTPDRSSVHLQPLAKIEPSQRAETPATIGLFHDPLAAANIVRGA
jgi:hypothetical protein